MTRLAPVFIAVLLTACPNKTERKGPEPQRCERFGQPCEFSPGKLGSCVERTGCTGPNCLICQSQH